MMKSPLLFPVLLLLGVLSARIASAADRPNILFIMTDDHAAHAISAYGGKVNTTPNMDRLASEGMRFDRCFATNSICTPSRATLLTGKYSHKNGVPVFNRFDGSQPVVSRMLQQAGYHTAIIGKWHLGSDPTGFDHWEILPGQGAYHDPVLYTAEGQKKHNGYVTDVITRLTIETLEKRPADKPFFLMCHHKAPHRPWEPSPKYREEFAKRTFPEPDNLLDDYTGRTDALKQNKQTLVRDFTRRDLKLEPPADLKGPARNQWLSARPDEVTITENGENRTLRGDELTKWKYQRYMRDYLACVQSVDDSVGELLAWLEAHDLRKNTVVIYTSDQGFFLGEHGMYDKRFMYEESLRMPFLVSWPAVVKPGSVTDALAINPDFAPTFLDLAGAPVPADMQGRSLVPLLRGEAKPAGWRESLYYRYYHDPGHHHTAAHYGVRTATHKLIHYWKLDQWELYDLEKDPREMRNIYAEPGSEEVAAKLKAEITGLQKELGDEGQFTGRLPPDGVDGAPAALRGK